MLRWPMLVLAIIFVTPQISENVGRVGRVSTDGQ